MSIFPLNVLYKRLGNCLPRPFFTRLCTDTCCSIDDPEVFDGMPVGLQIMGRRLEEEKVLAIAKELEPLLR